MTVITQRPGIAGAEKIRSLPAGEKVFARERKRRGWAFLFVLMCSQRMERKNASHGANYVAAHIPTPLTNVCAAAASAKFSARDATTAGMHATVSQIF
jgi:hypothetical protein